MSLLVNNEKKDNVIIMAQIVLFKKPKISLTFSDKKIKSVGRRQQAFTFVSTVLANFGKGGQGFKSGKGVSDLPPLFKGELEFCVKQTIPLYMS